MSSQTDLDRSILFECLQGILDELYRKVIHHLAISPKPERLVQYFSSPNGEVSGSLLTFTKKEIDKLVYSWLNDTQSKFSTMRLTIWLSPLIEVPHLAFEFGTRANLFFYMDYISRVDLWANLNYVKSYYEPVNSTYLELRDNPNLSVFVSKEMYVRQLQSPAHLCFTCPRTEDSLSLIKKIAHQMCDRWLTWVKQATPISADSQAILAERDLRMRRISAERDPGNIMAAKIFGTQLTNQLVRALWSKEPITLVSCS